MAALWFDFTNPPHVNFYLPLIRHFKNQERNLVLSARNFVETTLLLDLNELEYKLIGKHGGKNKISKIFQLIRRDLMLFAKINSFDLSLSSNYDAPFVSWLKRKPSIVFDDNDISPNWLYSKFANYVITPDSIDKDSMYKMGISEEKLITYPGFKENIYIADYVPDISFYKKLPFKDYVVVRPENMQASYVVNNAKSIVPELVHRLIQSNINVLYLPRYKSDRSMIQNSKRIFIPDSPLNGLDVCFHSNAVLTGAGTFSREAAVLGIPAVSFFAGQQFLGVDKKMFSENLVLYSRNPDEIVNYVIKSSRKLFDQQRSIDVQNEFFRIVGGLVSKFIK